MLLSSNVNFLTGHLLLSAQGPIEKAELLRCEGMTFVQMIGSSRWEELRYTSKVPLYAEDPNLIPPPYRYTVVCRRSDARLLLLSEHSDIVNHLLSTGLKQIFAPHLRPINIAVDRLVKALTAKPDIYVMSYAHARVPIGSNLTSLTFYGDDLGESPLFRETLHGLNFTNCGLRLAARGKEIVRVGVDGAVSFFPVNRQRLDYVERILGFLRGKGYFSDSSDDVNLQDLEDQA